jgi:eukaryotic-like serine/threonine-protein kinase
MPADPKLVRDLFLAAAELPSAERASYLAANTGGDAEVRAAVERLLAAHEQPAEVLLRPAPGMPTADYAPITERVGTLIGHYKLMEQIGEGGFGLVFVAEQMEPVKRKVALKIIKPGMDSKSVIARFEAERQALALMDHPNIARVLDAGATESGRPYFVMELVRGIPITEYCDQNQLTPNERLELFISVCHAIQHAHQKGIIHRDVKPSNVLVTSHDGKPVAKVIDFGVAKAIHQHLTERTIYTNFAQMIGTPLYMSPEQAEMSGLDIDTRSDIYSLGVLLYELLTGSTPLEKKRFREAAYDEMRRLIREEVPPRPSERLSTCDTLPSLAANRKTEPAKLSRMLRGELDWVVMKALEKDRTRRYETANGLARDIQRYLADEVVEARPPSTGYRLRKFARKNRAALTTAAAIALLLVAGVAVSAWQAVRATRAEQAEAERAEGERRAKLDAQANEKLAGDRLVQVEAERNKANAAKIEAQAKEAEANAVVKFFEEQVFAAARPKWQDGGLGAGVTLRDAVVASLPALRQGFAAQPLVEARLRLTLSITFYYLAEHELARDQEERARALFTRHRGPDHPDTLRSMNNLANSYYSMNRQAEALQLREEVLEIQKRVLPKDHPDTLNSMSNLALSYEALNRPAEALKLREEVLEIRKRVLPKDHPNTLRTMTGLADSYAALNRPTEALQLREKVLAIQKRVLPKDHPETLGSMHNLATSYYSLNRHAEALKLLEEVLEIRKRVLPKDHPGTLMSMHNLALSYEALNRPAEALKLREEVLEIRKRVLFKDHPDTLQSMISLSNSYGALNRHADVLKLREEVLEIRKRVLPKDHPDTLLMMWGVAVALIQLDRGAEAIPLIDACVAKAAGQAVHPLLIPNVLALRMGHFRKVADPAGCRATAEMWEKLSRKDAGSLYDAACLRAVTAAVQAKTPGADAARLAKDDADRAMAWLTKAVAAGYKNAAHMKKNADLDSLREREDFKKLIAELEAKTEKK